jgi:phage-related protein
MPFLAYLVYGLRETPHYGETYRCAYTAKLGDTIYVLHAFQKKSKRGIATPKADIKLIEARLKEARQIHQELENERKKGK